MDYPEESWEHRSRTKRKEKTKTTTTTTSVTGSRIWWGIGGTSALATVIYTALVQGFFEEASGEVGKAAGKAAIQVAQSSSPPSSPSASPPSSPVSAPSPTATAVAPSAEASPMPGREPETAMQFIRDYAEAMKGITTEGDLANWFTPSVDWYARPAVDFQYLFGVIKPQVPVGTVKTFYGTADYQRFTKSEGEDELVVSINFVSATTSGTTYVRYTLVPSTTGQPYRIRAAAEQGGSGS